MPDTPADAATSNGDAGSLLATLLARLRADGEREGVAYERLRARLIAFFRLHEPSDAEALADLALDRLARRLQEGVAVDNVRLYALGIARLVVQERRARAIRQRRAEHDPTLQPNDDSAAETRRVEATSIALGACLQQVGDSATALILAYYGADGAARIRARSALAASLGVSLNALRNRALRLRDTLERCVRERLPPNEDA